MPAPIVKLAGASLQSYRPDMWRGCIAFVCPALSRFGGLKVQNLVNSRLPLTLEGLDSNLNRQYTKWGPGWQFDQSGNSNITISGLATSKQYCDFQAFKSYTSNHRIHGDPFSASGGSSVTQSGNIKRTISTAGFTPTFQTTAITWSNLSHHTIGVRSDTRGLSNGGGSDEFMELFHNGRPVTFPKTVTHNVANTFFGTWTPVQTTGGFNAKSDNFCFGFWLDRIIPDEYYAILNEDPTAMFRPKIFPGLPDYLKAPATGITVTPSPVTGSWSVVAPSFLKEYTQSAVTGSWATVAPTLVKTYSQTPVGGTWSTVTPTTTKAYSQTAVTGSWTTVAPTLIKTYSQTAVTGSWSTVAPSFLKTYSQTPVGGTWTVVAPSIPGKVTPDPIVGTWSVVSPTIIKTYAQTAVSGSWGVVAPSFLKTYNQSAVTGTWSIIVPTIIGPAVPVSSVEIIVPKTIYAALWEKLKDNLDG